MIRGLFLIVARTLRQHAVSTSITVASAALASGLVMAVFSIRQQTHEAFVGGPVGFDAVLGARGSQLQLVLNTVFHLETSPGNIPWATYIAAKNAPGVQLAIPYAVGDNYQGFRIVGTTEEIFSKFQYQKGKSFRAQPGGRFFDPKFREAVLGSVVAERTGMKVGDTFNPYHGILYDESMKHAEEYVVVGVLEPTNSPSDKVLWIPIEGIFRLGGHVLRGSGKEFAAKPGEEIPDEAKEVSAVMIKFSSPHFAMEMSQKVNHQGTVATLAWPIGNVMADLFDKLGWVDKILGLVSFIVVLVAAASIVASLYNAMNERRRDFAILRALGARKRIVFSSIVIEASLIAGLGGLIGVLLQYGVLAGAAIVVRRETGVVLDIFGVHPAVLITPLAMFAVGALAGIVPAVKAYRTDVAEHLAPVS